MVACGRHPSKLDAGIKNIAPPPPRVEPRDLDLTVVDETRDEDRWKELSDF